MKLFVQFRSCPGGRPGQPGCTGDATMVTPCSTVPCASWTQWSSAESCSATCDGGIIRHTRVCLDKTCSGPSSRTVVCSTLPCSYWSGWTEYGDCSVTCGTGVRVRTRDCQGGVRGDNGCQGIDRQTIPCTASSPACVKATWGQWTESGECSAKCGVGQRSRVRTCIGGVTGQIGCEGPSKSVVSCNLRQCGKWEAWGSWSRCTSSCGSGRRYQTRFVLNMARESGHNFTKHWHYLDHAPVVVWGVLIAWDPVLKLKNVTKPLVLQLLGRDGVSGVPVL